MRCPIRLGLLGCCFAWMANAGEGAPAGPALTPARLSCDWGIDPLGVDSPKPVLRWELESTMRAAGQSAYEVMVASEPEILAQGKGDVWDSGKVASDHDLQVAYGGPALKTAERVYWKVHVWDQNGAEAGWSAPATWTMGVVKSGDWGGAEWIGSGPIAQSAPIAEPGSIRVRREFEVKPQIKRALIYVSGLGQYELTIDGAKVGSDLLTPGWTDYRKTCLYDTYDVTAQLARQGQHAMGLLLGNGMYNVEDVARYHKFTGTYGPQMAIGLLRIEYADGTVETIPTDGQWQAGAGPITFSHVFGGEDYDARLEAPGWDKPGFRGAASDWRPAGGYRGPGGALRGFSFAAPPVRAIEILKGAPGREIRRGVMVYDLGQNASIMPAITVRGAAGSAVKITPAELLKKDGSVDRGSVGGGDAYWKYTLAGTGEGEAYFPKFFYHGCRYLQVERLAPPGGGDLPLVLSVDGVVIQSSAAPAGTFSCSNELFNRIATLVRWAQRSNMMSVLTDCPHRERLGWMEQDHLNGPSLRYDYRMERLFAKIDNDIADAEEPGGLVPEIAPEYVVFPARKSANFHESVEWGSALLLVAQQQYEWTGDLDLLRQHYDAMKRYVDHLGAYAPNGILDIPGDLGDWYDIGPKRPGVSQLTPVALTETAFYFEDASVLAEAAELLGNAVDALKYKALAAEIRAAFNAKFYDTQKEQYGTGSQCANAIALVMGLVEPAQRSATLDALAGDVTAKGNTAGDIGYRYVLRALADGGRSEVIGDMNNQSDKPGYGYQLKMGATSLTEAWDAARSSSQNHFMLGQIVEWFYHDLAGIQEDPAGPGFRRIIIRPQPAGNVTWVNASYDSARGRIAVEWKSGSTGFDLGVSIPSGSTATVFMPARAADQVSESGAPATIAKGVKFIENEGGRAVFEVSSGYYHFNSLP